MSQFTPPAKHGLNSATVVLASESPEEYAELLSDYLHRYAPVGTAELDLVHEIAAARWRLRRIVRMESAIFDRQIELSLEASSDADPALALAENLKPITMLGRYENRIRRSYEKALVELKALQTTRKSTEEANKQNEPKPIATPEAFVTNSVNLDRSVHLGHMTSLQTQARVGGD